MSKSSWWLLKGEATSFAVKPTVLGAEQSTMAVFPVMLIPGSDDYANLIAHARPYDLQGQLHGLTLAPFEREVENKPAGILFYLCYECDQIKFNYDFNDYVCGGAQLCYTSDHLKLGYERD